MEYKILVKKIGNALAMTRKVDQAADDLAREVNEYVARGWEPLGGVAMGVAGTAPYLLQAMIRRR
jgi:hypothetical protein